MASLTRWTWVWVSSRSWWWTGKPGVLQSMGSQRVRHNWVTELILIHYPVPGNQTATQDLLWKVCAMAEDPELRPRKERAEEESRQSASRSYYQWGKVKMVAKKSNIQIKGHNEAFSGGGIKRWKVQSVSCKVKSRQWWSLGQTAQQQGSGKLSLCLCWISNTAWQSAQKSSGHKTTPYYAFGSEGLEFKQGTARKGFSLILDVWVIS